MFSNKSYFVYSHTSPSGKVYIGITSNLHRRWEGEGCNYKQCPVFYAAIKKYGWGNMTHTILYEGLTFQEAGNKERELIKHYKELGISYNVADGGEGGGHPAWNKGIPLTPECKEKLRIANLNKKLSDETRRKISEYQRTKVVSEETKRKIGKANSKAHTKDHIMKFRESCRWRFIPVRITKDGIFIGDFESLNDAVVKFGLNKGNAYRALKSKTHYCNGYIIRTI